MSNISLVKHVAAYQTALTENTVTKFMVKWVFSPVIYFFILSVFGFVVITFIDVVADSNMIGNLPNWQQVLAAFIVGLVAKALWSGRHYKSPNVGAGR